MPNMSVLIFLLALSALVVLAIFDLRLRYEYIHATEEPAPAGAWDERGDMLRGEALTMALPYSIALLLWLVTAYILRDFQGFGHNQVSDIGLLVVGGLTVAVTMHNIGMALQSLLKYRKVHATS